MIRTILVTDHNFKRNLDQQINEEIIRRNITNIIDIKFSTTSNQQGAVYYQALLIYNSDENPTSL